MAGRARREAAAGAPRTGAGPAAPPRPRPAGAGQPATAAAAAGLGAAAGKFTFPMSVAALPGGRICVADRRACQIRVYGPAGRLELAFGSRGSLPGRFAHPAGLAALPGGRICVADCENHRVQVLAPRGGRFVPELAFGSRTPAAAAAGPAAPLGTFSFPLGVAALPGGRICVADTKNHRVQVFGPGGGFELQLGSGAARGDAASTPALPAGLRSPRAAAAGPRGRTYVVGGLTRVGPGGAGPCADAVHVFGPSGDPEFSFGPHGAGRGMVDAPAGIAVDARGRVLVADTGNGRVLAFDEDGRFEYEFAGSGRRAALGIPTGVAARADGTVCIAEAHGSRVRVLGRGGRQVLVFGAGGTGRAPAAT